MPHQLSNSNSHNPTDPKLWLFLLKNQFLGFLGKKIGVQENGRRVRSRLESRNPKKWPEKRAAVGIPAKWVWSGSEEGEELIRIHKKERIRGV